MFVRDYALKVLTFFTMAIAMTGEEVPRSFAPAASTNFAEGISLGRTEEILGVKGDHQYTKFASNGTVVCLRFDFYKNNAPYYFVFRDELLEKIVKPPPLRVKTVPFRSGTRAYTLPTDPYERIAAVDAQPVLLGQAFYSSLSNRLAQLNQPSNVLPAFNLLAPLLGPKMMAVKERTKGAYEINTKIKGHLNPRKIKAGMGLKEVEGVFGKAWKHTEQNGLSVLAFKEDVPGEVKPEDRASPVAVLLKDGKVLFVFSHEFFSPEFFFPADAP